MGFNVFMKYSLKKSTHFKKNPGPLVLIILDGVGIGKKDNSNAVHIAHTPCLDLLMSSHLYTELKAHGTAVGMPSDEDMGNSEVGHNTLGSGRALPQGATLVNTSIKTKKIYNSPTWNSSMNHCLNYNSTLHFIGLLSDGNVHSHINHLIDMLDKSAKEKVKKVRIHCLLDGRDVDERSALSYVAQLENKLSTINNTEGFDYAIASGGGRMLITMDRYNADWKMVEKGWETHVLGNARHFSSAKQAIQTMYTENNKITDQYLPPFVISDDASTPIGKIKKNDSIIFFNFRGDRAIEMSMAFESQNFDKFNRAPIPNINFSGMLSYDGDLNIPKNYLVDPPFIDDPLSKYLCYEGIRSFAISETQKYGHVTYFRNGNSSGYIDKSLEKYIEIPSYTGPFDEKPEMRAPEIAEKTIELLKSGLYDFGRINFPNGDMIGHTGNFNATVKSVEAADTQLSRLLETINELKGTAIVLADHGNADEMYVLKNGIKKTKTAHSLNSVPCAIVDPLFKNTYIMKSISPPGLSNIAATICNLLGFEAPTHFDSSLIAPL